MSERPTLTPGVRLASAVCSTEVIVVQVSDPAAVIECGGAPMVVAGTPLPCSATPQSGPAGGSRIGKRYGGPTAAVEVLCVKAGAGTLAVNGVALEQRIAKALPASD
jgi:hypothetical protein